MLKKKKYINIRKFIFIKNFSNDKNTLNVWSLKNNKKLRINIKKNSNYLIGYLHNKENDGEFIKIENKNFLTKIQNDNYASHHLYKYIDTNLNIAVYSNSIDEIFKLKDTKKILDIKNIYEYFAYGYIPSSKETIFKNITLTKGNTTIKINKKIREQNFQKNIFKEKSFKVTISNVKSKLKAAIKKKLKKKSISTLCMTSGLDTLLGAYYFTNLEKNISLSTWGTKNTNDIIRAKIRKKKFFKRSKHFILEIENKKIPEKYIKQYAYDTGGFGNLSAINIMLFTKFLFNKKKYHYYCDHYESTRRIFENIDNLISKYETPKNIIKKNLFNFHKYKRIVSKVHRRIKTNFKKDKCKNFYFYDRYIKGTAMKNQIVSLNGSIKISLPIEYKFLNSISNFIDLNKEKPYEKLFNLNHKDINKELKITKDISSKNKHKPMPFDQFYLLRNFKNLFLDEICKAEKSDLKKIFNFNKIKRTIKNESFLINEQWFLLRLLSLVIFFNKFKLFKII